MSNLMAPGAGNLTMSSQEIAELVGSRHDSVKRTIERLAEKQIISKPPLVVNGCISPHISGEKQSGNNRNNRGQTIGDRPRY